MATVTTGFPTRATIRCVLSRFMNHRWSRCRLICQAVTVFACCVLLADCSARNHRQGSSSQPTPAYHSLSPASISEHALEERSLADYKRYYERFRHIEDVHSALPIQQEARLAQDYAVAREEFHSWLWFVADTIQQQSQLEPAFREGQPDNEYVQRTARASAAMNAFDRDLRDVLPDRNAEPSFSSERQLYELGRTLVVTFSNPGPDSARIAGEELLTKYSWEGQ